MATQQELSVRREILKKLFSFGLTQADAAYALGLDASSVRNDLDKIGNVEVSFDTTTITNSQRRDKAFDCAFREWCCIHDVSDYAERIGVDQEVARGIVNALHVYLDIRRINGILEGAISSIENMLTPTDPPEYQPHRQLLNAVFGEKPRKISKEDFLTSFYMHLAIDHVEVTRDLFPSQLAVYSLDLYKDRLGMPFTWIAKVAVDEAIKSLPYEPCQKVLRLRFGLSGEAPLSFEECGIRMDVTAGRIRQIEAKGLRQLRHPERARRLRLLLESPFGFTHRMLHEIFTPPVPPPTPIVYKGVEIGNIEELLAKSVEELDLSVRSYNALKNNNINTIGELVQKTEGYEEGGALKMKNFGRKSLNEIKELLEPMGLCFGMKLENGVLTRPIVQIPSEDLD